MSDAAASASAERAVPCAIAWRRDWTPWLFSFRTERPTGLRFAAGQFVRLGVEGSDGRTVWRAYSIASAPDDGHLEFYSIVVPDGPFTQPFSRCGVGDAISIDPTVYGFLRSDRFDGGRDLWLLATGTGIAPFRSMIADPALAPRFDRIVVVHSVRTTAELAYRDDFAGWATAPGSAGKRFYRPTLTGSTGATAAQPAPAQEVVATALNGRITTLLADGGLERSLGFAPDAPTSNVMICGNPSMIRETRALLGSRGLRPLRRDAPGHFISENFW